MSAVYRSFIPYIYHFIPGTLTSVEFVIKGVFPGSNSLKIMRSHCTARLINKSLKWSSYSLSATRLFIFFKKLCVPLCLRASHICGNPWRPKNIRSPETGIADGCEPSAVDTGNQIQAELLTSEPSVQTSKSFL